MYIKTDFASQRAYVCKYSDYSFMFKTTLNKNRKEMNKKR